MITTQDIKRAYGCSHQDACELLRCETEFALAVRSIGPLLAHRSSDGGWTLKGKPAFRDAFIRYAGLAA